MRDLEHEVAALRTALELVCHAAKELLDVAASHIPLPDSGHYAEIIQDARATLAAAPAQPQGRLSSEPTRAFLQRHGIEFSRGAYGELMELLHNHNSAPAARPGDGDHSLARSSEDEYP